MVGSGTSLSFSFSALKLREGRARSKELEGDEEGKHGSVFNYLPRYIHTRTHKPACTLIVIADTIMGRY